MNRYRRFIKPILLLLILTLVIPMPLMRVENAAQASSTGNLQVAYNVEGVSFGSFYYWNIEAGLYRIEVCRFTSAGWRWGVNYGTRVHSGSMAVAIVFIYSFGQPCYYSWEYNTVRLTRIGN